MSWDHCRDTMSVGLIDPLEVAGLNPATGRPKQMFFHLKIKLTSRGLSPQSKNTKIKISNEFPGALPDSDQRN